MMIKYTLLSFLFFLSGNFLIANSPNYLFIYSPKDTVILPSKTDDNLGFSFEKLLTPASDFNKTRFWSMMGTGVGIYVPTVFALDKLWYSKFERGKFHYFNDSGEWLEMDKAGHILTAYTEANWSFIALNWAGLNNRQASLLGIGASTLLQLTVEVMDGFVNDYGFSWADIGSNLAGSTIFGMQQLLWEEQRIVLKVSNTPISYSDKPIMSQNGTSFSSLKSRSSNLYGDNYTQTFFKDYNALIFWMSVNPKSFYKNSCLPGWLNLAVGYGSHNLYGGFSNSWIENNALYTLSEVEYPRIRQYYFSLDIDLTKIKTKSRIIKTLARTFNFIKIPSPAIEYNSLGKLKFHPFLF